MWRLFINTICGCFICSALIVAPAFASADDNTRAIASAIEHLGGEMGIGGGLAWAGFWIGLGLFMSGVARSR